MPSVTAYLISAEAATTEASKTTATKTVFAAKLIIFFEKRRSVCRFSYRSNLPKS